MRMQREERQRQNVGGVRGPSLSSILWKMMHFKINLSSLISQVFSGLPSVCTQNLGPLPCCKITSWHNSIAKNDALCWGMFVVKCNALIHRADAHLLYLHHELRCLPRPHTSVYARPPQGCGLAWVFRLEKRTTTEWTQAPLEVAVNIWIIVHIHLLTNQRENITAFCFLWAVCSCCQGWTDLWSPQARKIPTAKSTWHIYLHHVTSDEAPQNQL